MILMLQIVSVAAVIAALMALRLVADYAVQKARSRDRLLSPDCNPVACLKPCHEQTPARPEQALPDTPDPARPDSQT